MAGRKITLDEKIEKAQNAMYRAKARYEETQNELKALLEKKSEMDLKEITEAVKRSDRSKDEILKFLAGDDGEDG